MQRALEQEPRLWSQMALRWPCSVTLAVDLGQNTKSQVPPPVTFLSPGVQVGVKWDAVFKASGPVSAM